MIFCFENESRASRERTLISPTASQICLLWLRVSRACGAACRKRSGGGFAPCGEVASLQATSQARDLSVSARRSVASRPVRLQAATRKAEWREDPFLTSEVGGHGRTRPNATPGSAGQLQPPWRERPSAVRHATASRSARRRHLHPTRHAIGQSESCAGANFAALWEHDRILALDGFVGFLRPWNREPRPSGLHYAQAGEQEPRLRQRVSAVYLSGHGPSKCRRRARNGAHPPPR